MVQFLETGLLGGMVGMAGEALAFVLVAEVFAWGSPSWELHPDGNLESNRQ